MDSESMVSQNCEEFAIDLYKDLAKKYRGDMIFSPIGAYIILSMTTYGASGNTESQLKKGLRLPADDIEALQGFQKLICHLDDITTPKLYVPTKIFISKSENVEIKEEFQSKIEKYFSSKCEALDFSNDSKASAAAIINNWCSNRTENKINKVVSKDELSNSTKILLVNAVYFKADWQHDFLKYPVELKPFYVNEHTEIKVPMMRQKNHFMNGELIDVNAKFVELYFKSDETKEHCTFKMIVIIPNEIEGLSEVEQNLEKIKLDRISECGKKDSIDLSIPKFKIESLLNAKESIKNIGITDMFTNAANFNKITDEILGVDQIIQKAYFDVDEKGVEVAVSWRESLNRKKYVPPPKLIVANRPFLMIITFEKMPLLYARFTGL